MKLASLNKPRLKIGILGGSFNPAHEGHVFVSKLAKRKLGLDKVIWLVSKNNPLKETTNQDNFEQRLVSAQQIPKPRYIYVSDFENDFENTYSYFIIESLIKILPKAQLVWIMGADSFIELPTWRNWQKICRLINFAVCDRKNSSLKILRSKSGLYLRKFYKQYDQIFTPAPGFTFLGPCRIDISSTEIRSKQ